MSRVTDLLLKVVTLRKIFFVSIPVVSLVSILGIASSIYGWQTLAVVADYSVIVIAILIVFFCTRHLAHTIIVAMNKSQREATRRSERFSAELLKHQRLVENSSKQLSDQIGKLNSAMDKLKESADARESKLLNSVTTTELRVVESVAAGGAEVGARIEEALQVGRIMAERNKIAVIGQLNKLNDDMLLRVEEIYGTGSDDTRTNMG